MKDGGPFDNTGGARTEGPSTVGCPSRRPPAPPALLDTLRAGWTSGNITTPDTRERITAAIATILTAGARTGSLRTDVDPDDVTTMLLGVFLSTTAGSTPERTGRLLDLVLDALRPNDRTAD